MKNQSVLVINKKIDDDNDADLYAHTVYIELLLMIVDDSNDYYSE